MRVHCLEIIFQSVFDEVHLLYEKENWKTVVTDKHGAITDLPKMYGNIVSASIPFIEEAFKPCDHEDDPLPFKNDHHDLKGTHTVIVSSILIF